MSKRFFCPNCNSATKGLKGDANYCGHCRGFMGYGPAANEAEQALYAPKIAEIKRWQNKADQRETVAKIGELILADIRNETKERKHAKPRIRYEAKKEAHLLEVAPVDLHVGKLSWGEETGTDYDIRIAEQVFTDAIEDILERAKAYQVTQIVFPVGNDLLQVDSPANTTTAGTYVDTDSRYIKSFRRARAITSWAIHEMGKVAPVLVPIVPGNHDRITAFHLGEVLEAEFASDSHIQIDNRPLLRKYHRFGITLLGWTHGSEEKAADLPLLMANECSEWWSATRHHEWHVGHMHKMKETRYTAGDSFQGVRVRILPSLCAPDAWHYSRGFVHERRACEAFLYGLETGYAGHLSSNVRTEAA